MNVALLWVKIKRPVVSIVCCNWSNVISSNGKTIWLRQRFLWVFGFSFMHKEKPMLQIPYIDRKLKQEDDECWRDVLEQSIPPINHCAFHSALAPTQWLSLPFRTPIPLLLLSHMGACSGNSSEGRQTLQYRYTNTSRTLWETAHLGTEVKIKRRYDRSESNECVGVSVTSF